MPSTHIANSIRQSLATNESAEDADFLFDTLLSLREQLNLSKANNEKITGALLCFLFPAKPAQYKADMQAFRLSLSGIASNIELQDKFRSSILPAALTVEESDLSQIVWDSSLYFVQQVQAEGGGYLTAN
jgi:hypothetical protein